MMTINIERNVLSREESRELAKSIENLFGIKNVYKISIIDGNVEIFAYKFKEDDEK